LPPGKMNVPNRREWPWRSPISRGAIVLACHLYTEGIRHASSFMPCVWTAWR
jgi:hypothetical protein